MDNKAFEKLANKTNKTTVSLIRELEYSKNFEEFMEMNKDCMLNVDDNVGKYLFELIEKYDKKMTVVSEEAGLNRSYVGNIVNGKKNNPSRDTLICICFAIGTTHEEVQTLLKYAGYAPLYPRRQRDMIIEYGFFSRVSLYDVNKLLEYKDLTPLIKNIV